MSHRLVITGAAACFPKPEISSNPVTCDVIPPIAARGIFEAIHWTPAIQWQIERIDVLRPVRMQWVDRGAAGLAFELIDVEYLIHARFELTPLAGSRDNAAQHANMFRTRAKRQRFFRQPYLGRPDLRADVRLIDKGEEIASHHAGTGAVDLGWMPYDRAFTGDHRLRFFRPRMIDGVIDLTAIDPVTLPS